jgi:hypothetical protein
MYAKRKYIENTLSKHKLLNQKPECQNNRVDRVLGFFSSRPNRDPPPPQLQVSVSRPLVLGEAHSLAGEGVGGGSQFMDEGKTMGYEYSRYICTLWSKLMKESVTLVCRLVYSMLSG